MSEHEFLQDVNSLRIKWQEILAKEKNASICSLIYQDVDMISKLVRDLMTDDVDECMIDNSSHYHRLKQEIQLYPEIKGALTHYKGNQNIFDYYQITADLERSLRKKVWLKNGGYLIIDQTEALTVIDINTGKYTGHQNLEETVYITNVEAAKEIARQLRLRDIGGIVIIDFIDMILPEHQENVLQALEEVVKKDRTKTNVVGITALGLVEMTRKKIRQNVLEVTTKFCSYCDGKGYTASEETIAAQVERILLEYRNAGDIEGVLVQVHPSVAAKLFGEGRSSLRELEKHCGFKVYLHGTPHNHLEEYQVIYMGSLAETKRKLEALQQKLT
nr:ribonuclease E/G [Caldalkalibacillus mannanilyticus]